MKKTAPNLYEVLRTTMAAAPARRASPRKVSPHPAPDPETEPAPGATQVAVEEPPEPGVEETYAAGPSADSAGERSDPHGSTGDCERAGSRGPGGRSPPEDVPEPEPTPPVAEAEADPLPEPEPDAQSFAPEPEPEPPAPEPEAALPEEPPEPPPAPTATWPPPFEPAAQATAEPEARSRTPLGERRVHASYNTLLFAGLVLLIAFFAAYSAGFQRGRAAAEPVDPAPVEPPAGLLPSDPQVAPLAPAPAAPAAFRIAVMCWEMPNARERQIARSNAQRISDALRLAGFPDVETIEGTSDGGTPALWVCVGRFTDRSASEANAWLERVREYAYNGQRRFTGAGWVRTDDAR